MSFDNVKFANQLREMIDELTEQPSEFSTLKLHYVAHLLQQTLRDLDFSTKIESVLETYDCALAEMKSDGLDPISSSKYRLIRDKLFKVLKAAESLSSAPDYPLQNLGPDHRGRTW